MSNSASLIYTVPKGGAPTADIESAVVGVPLPTDILLALGLRVVSDITVIGPPVVRTVNLSLVSATLASAIAHTLSSQPSGSPIESISLAAGGSGYIAPPGVQIVDTLGGQGRGAKAKAFLNIGTIAITLAGTSYGPDTFALPYGGLPPGNGGTGQTSFTYDEVLRTTVTSGGVGYSPKTTVTFVGGLTPGGTPATGAVQIASGVITGIVMDGEGDEYLTAPHVVINDPTGAGSGAAAVATMVPGKTVYFQGRMADVIATVGGGHVITIGIPDSGDGYISVPQILLIDPSLAGSGAVLTPSMEVDKIVVTNGGEGYQNPSVILTPYFKVLFPDVGDQRKPLFNLITTALSKATRTQVVASAPVMS
jgi:hypothetical protein